MPQRQRASAKQPRPTKDRSAVSDGRRRTTKKAAQAPAPRARPRGRSSKDRPVVATTLKIKLVRSPIGNSQRHKDTVRSLGLRRMNQLVERADNEQIRGMIYAVRHLVQVVE